MLPACGLKSMIPDTSHPWLPSTRRYSLKHLPCSTRSRLLVLFFNPHYYFFLFFFPLPFFWQLSRDPKSDVELVFLVDRSASMTGTALIEARRALHSCLWQLPVGATFNVVSFGSSVEWLLPTAASTSDTVAVQMALQFASSFDCDLGGE